MLRKGMTIRLPDNSLWKVVKVNECRALVIPLAKRVVKYKTIGGKTVEFKTKGQALGISPNSEVEVIARKVKQ